MRLLYKILVNLIVVVVFLVAFYCFQIPSGYSQTFYRSADVRNGSTRAENSDLLAISSPSVTESIHDKHVSGHGNTTVGSEGDAYNVWCIFTKVSSNSPMKRKFKIFTASLLRFASVRLAFHVIGDAASREIAKVLIRDVVAATGKLLDVWYYDAAKLAAELEDLVSTMSPHFSSNPGTYYSDALFFLSLGLHRVAPPDQRRAVMFDADTKFRMDVKELFYEFDNFGPEALFGLAPELTPVYRHVLYLYRSKHPDTRFGEPAYSGGFPGFNSGMVLFDFEKLRNSLEYEQIVSRDSVAAMTDKYRFKGHLGDQDFYTILGMERPELIHKVDCGWNRQLCTWWRDHGYEDMFANYSRCDALVKLWHGNCNTPIPDY